MTEVGCCLSWFVTQHHHVSVDQSEGINNHLRRTGASCECSLTNHFMFLVHSGLEIITRSCTNYQPYLSFNTLNRINHHCNSSLWQGLKALLCVDVHARQPAAKTRVTVVPTHHHLRSIEQHRWNMRKDNYRQWPRLSIDIIWLQYSASDNCTVYLPVCFSISNILAWNTGSTASTLTPCRAQNGQKSL